MAHLEKKNYYFIYLVYFMDSVWSFLLLKKVNQTI